MIASKNIICSLYFILLIIFVKENKAKKSIPSLFDFNLDDINDEVIKKNKEFNLNEEKETILLAREKLKKLACLNLINKITKDADDELKNKLKDAKETNKNNFKQFIDNMTDCCTKQIKQDKIKRILKYQNVINNKINADKNILEFDKYFTELSKKNEYYKKIKEMEIQKEKRFFLIKMFAIIICIFIVCLILVKLLKKCRRKDKEEKDDKKKLKKN